VKSRSPEMEDMMTDLVKGLRTEAEFACLGPDCLNTQAADEIERLQSLVDELMKELDMVGGSVAKQKVSD
jgi:hypothetical protein